ncbi:unnamed protein product [Ectocarpus sp. CCAP 1310/34]|nr:unnamed protein product [Ectocarpus sp. CCAP 1310/34]
MDARSGSQLALAESQNIQQVDQVGAGLFPTKNPVSASLASSSATPASSSASPAASSATGDKKSLGVAAAVDSPAQGSFSSKERRPGGRVAASAPAPPATPAVVATTATAPTAPAAATATAFATPAAPASFATPAAPTKAGRVVTVGGGQPAGGGGGGAAAAAAAAAGGGGSDDSSAVDRMILASPAAFGEGPAEAVPAVVDTEAESLALARQLMEEEAMASYAAAVDNFRSAAAAARAAGGGLDGVAPEDMAAMQALMEEDENNPDAFAMAEDESLDYDGMLELGSAIGDVRKDRWRMRCKSVIAALPQVSYTAGGYSGGEDTKCLVCQCDYEEDDELRILPCSHAFHTGIVRGRVVGGERGVPHVPTLGFAADVKNPPCTAGFVREESQNTRVSRQCKLAIADFERAAGSDPAELRLGGCTSSKLRWSTTVSRLQATGI